MNLRFLNWLYFKDKQTNVMTVLRDIFCKSFWKWEEKVKQIDNIESLDSCECKSKVGTFYSSIFLLHYRDVIIFATKESVLFHPLICMPFSNPRFNNKMYFWDTQAFKINIVINKILMYEKDITNSPRFALHKRTTNTISDIRVCKYTRYVVCLCFLPTCSCQIFRLNPFKFPGATITISTAV